VYGSQGSRRRCSRGVQIPRSTLLKLLHMRLIPHAYRIQTVQPDRLVYRPVPCARIRHRPDRMMTDSLRRVVCTADCNSHVSGTVTTILGSGALKNPHILLARLDPVYPKGTSVLYELLVRRTDGLLVGVFWYFH
jgi:hypothetical protein